jgi:hypothetical protein
MRSRRGLIDAADAGRQAAAFCGAWHVFGCLRLIALLRYRERGPTQPPDWSRASTHFFRVARNLTALRA